MTKIPSGNFISTDLMQYFRSIAENETACCLFFASLVSADNVWNEEDCDKIIDFCEKSLKVLKDDQEVLSEDKRKWFIEKFEKTIEIMVEDKKWFKKNRKNEK